MDGREKHMSASPARPTPGPSRTSSTPSPGRLGRANTTATFSGTAPAVRGGQDGYLHPTPHATSNGFLTLAQRRRAADRRLRARPRKAGEWLRQATLAIRARVPIEVLRDVIQPFPTFSEIYVDALKALRNEIADSRPPASSDGITVIRPGHQSPEER